MEEPESHLHPGAVHELRGVLEGIAKSQQVIVTTHSQALVNRHDFRQNLVVSEHTARPAKQLADLRTSLGVTVADSLTAAEVVVITEGTLDRGVLPAVLTQLDPEVTKWISDGRVIFEAAGGCSKVQYRVHSARSIMTNPVVVLDSDPAGNASIDKLLENGTLDQNSIVKIVRPNTKHSELEDVFSLDAYIDALQNAIGHKLTDREKRRLDRGDLAWSERLSAILRDAGFHDIHSLEVESKRAVAGAILSAVEAGRPVVREGCEDLLLRLIEVIRDNLQQR